MVGWLNPTNRENIMKSSISITTTAIASLAFGVYVGQSDYVTRDSISSAFDSAYSSIFSSFRPIDSSLSDREIVEVLASTTSCNLTKNFLVAMQDTDTIVGQVQHDDYSPSNMHFHKQDFTMFGYRLKGISNDGQYKADAVITFKTGSPKIAYSFNLIKLESIDGVLSENVNRKCLKDQSSADTLKGWSVKLSPEVPYDPYDPKNWYIPTKDDRWPID